jgi:hypothetical protein
MLSYETANMRCFFIFDDRKNTRWLKADRNGRYGSVSRKAQRGVLDANWSCTARLKVSQFGRLGSVLVLPKRGTNKAWYHSLIMPKRLRKLSQ